MHSTDWIMLLHESLYKECRGLNIACEDKVDNIRLWEEYREPKGSKK
jgi:hypothetical protein